MGTCLQIYNNCIFYAGSVPVGFINPWTGEEMVSSNISDHDEDSLHGECSSSYAYVVCVVVCLRSNLLMCVLDLPVLEVNTDLNP